MLQQISHTFFKHGLKREQVEKFNTSLKDLSSLKDRLDKLAMNHNKWQSLENRLRMIRYSMGQDIKELNNSWPYLQPKIEQLRRDNTYELISGFTKANDKLEEMISQGNPDSIKKSLRSFHTEVQKCLNAVDSNFKTFLNEFYKIGKSLDQVIRAMQ